MLKKYKKIILIPMIFILTLNFSFNYKVQKAEAFDFILTPTILWTLGTLVLGGGIYALNHEQINDMGQRVYDRFTSTGGKDEDLYRILDGVRTGLIIKDKLVSAADWVSANLPGNDIQLTSEPVDWVSTPSDFHLLSCPSPTFLPAKDSVKVLSATTTMKENNTIANFTIEGTPNSVYYNRQLCSSGLLDNNFTLSLVRDSDSYKLISSCSHGTVLLRDKISANTKIRFGFYGQDVINGAYWNTLNVPYSNPKVKENYVPGLIPQAIPYTNTKPGYIPIPLDIPTDKVISTDIPYTWDNVKDAITDLPVDTTIPGDETIPGDTTKPGDTTIPDFGGTGTIALDFSPLYINLKDKFPFCIPYDLVNTFNFFSADKVTPKFTIKFDEGLVGSGEFTIDFSRFEKIAIILRGFILLYFIFFLIKNTRNLTSN